MGFAEGFGEVAVRATLAGLLCLLLAACTAGGGEPEQPDRPAVPSLRLTVASVPLSCQPLPGAGSGCQVGGAGVAGGLGRVRLYHQVRLGQPQTGGCRQASIAGSLNGGAWSVPFSGDGEWCGRSAAFTYRLGGQPGGQGRLEYRHDPPAAATETFTGALPPAPTGAAARDPDQRTESAGCGRRPPARPGGSVDLEVPADPALSAGASRRGYRVHVPKGYRSDRPVPAVLLFHGNGGSTDDMEAVSGLSRVADRRGFVAVYPQGLSVGAGQAFWASSGRVELGIDELRFTADLLDDLQERLCVDPVRVTAAGHSAGGGVTARLACELAGRVAAVATVAAALFAEPLECRPSRAVAVLSMHGTEDEVLCSGRSLPPTRSPVSARGCPAGQVTSWRAPLRTSKTKPRMESLLGTNGLALMRATDWRTSRSTSGNDSRAKGGRWPTSASMSAFTWSSVKVSIPQSVWWTRITSRVPSRRWEMTSDRRTSSLTTPPALRITWASPSRSPSRA
jgi:poly(3-hydroxybutyrate) depolymerase